MRKIITIILMSTILFSCAAPQEKCEKAVKDYILLNSEDSMSYVSIDFTKLINQNIIIDGSENNVEKGYLIQHKYRISNKFNVLENKNFNFILNRKFEVIRVTDVKTNTIVIFTKF